MNLTVPDFWLVEDSDEEVVFEPELIADEPSKLQLSVKVKKKAKVLLDFVDDEAGFEKFTGKPSKMKMKSQKIKSDEKAKKYKKKAKVRKEKQVYRQRNLYRDTRAIVKLVEVIDEI